MGSKLADFQLEAKDHSTPITNGTRNIGVNDISGYKHTGSLSVISNSPKWVTDSRLEADQSILMELILIS